MSFESWYEHDAMVVGVNGPLDVTTRDQLKALVLQALDRRQVSFRLAFSRAGFVDSSGLGVLVSLQKRVSETGGSLRLSGLSEELRRLFALTKLDGVLRIDDEGEGSAGQHARLRPRPPDPRQVGDEAPRPFDQRES
jgi:anti-sigma B factor antagonist